MFSVDSHENCGASRRCYDHPAATWVCSWCNIADFLDISPVARLPARRHDSNSFLLLLTVSQSATSHHRSRLSHPSPRTCPQSEMPTTCPWCLDLGTPIHRISRTTIIRHKKAWLARQQLRQTGGHRDIPDSSNNVTDDGDIQASNAENGGYEPPTPDSDDGGESPGTIEPCKPVVYFPSALLSRVRPSVYGPKY